MGDPTWKMTNVCDGGSGSSLSTRIFERLAQIPAVKRDDVPDVSLDHWQRRRCSRNHSRGQRPSWGQSKGIMTFALILGKYQS